jgi:hypothetical protein
VELPEGRRWSAGSGAVLPEGRGNGLRPRYRYYAPELTEWMLGW